MSFCLYRPQVLMRVLQNAGANAMYVRDTANIEWLTGFEGVFDSEDAHAAFVDVSNDRILLHSDSRYIIALQSQAGGTPVEVDAEVISMSAWACERCRNAFGGEGFVLAIEDSMTLAEYRALEKAFCGDKASAEKERLNCSGPFLETSGLILDLRAVKDDAELSLLRAAQAITDDAFDHICGFISPGMTEREIQLELDDFMMRNGADELAFPSIIASGPNGASPHAQVTDRSVCEGECIVMDFGARRKGYCSDMTRTVFLGAPEEKMLDAWETLRRANESVQEMLEPGVTGVQAHELAEQVLADGGFGERMGHGLGHGVGIQVHELPCLNRRNDRPLVAGNVVTVEPGIYIPGEFGMRLEDFGVITDSGFERFTQSTHELIIL